jgi:Nucleotidyltransferase of unknown function (DUF6036)
MREPLTADSLELFIKALGAAAKTASRFYLVGGASAVLLGWRAATIDIDLKIIPETDELLRSLSKLKEQLHLNIELASREDFIPALPGWQERSRFIRQEGKLSFYHYDFYAQALAKIERGHDKDLIDVKQIIERDLVQPRRLLELFATIENQIHRYLALDARKFRASVEQVVREYDSGE